MSNSDGRGAVTPIRGLLFDLDGTVYRGDDPIPGAADFLRRAGAAGLDCLFVTNRANRTPEAVALQLNDMGIDCGPAQILTSAQATAAYLGPCRAYCLGEEGLHAALAEGGIALVESAPDAVVASYDRGLTYDKLLKAARFILEGARFLGTNPDPIIVLEDGPAPETGVTLAALTAATGRRPEIVGKPERAIIDSAVARLGLPREELVVVGDNIATDILAAQNAGLRSALILTGVSTRADLAAAATPPTWTAETYDDLAAALLV